jgi:hypothetical protein
MSDIGSAAVDVLPRSGPPGTLAEVRGAGFGPSELVVIGFRDAIAGNIRLANVVADGSGAFTVPVTIPATATVGKQRIVARGTQSGLQAEEGFGVT